MFRIIKALFLLAVLAFIGLVVYAYVPGTLAPDQSEIRKPVELNVGH
jgi:hypothetical protein